MARTDLALETADAALDFAASPSRLSERGASTFCQIPMNATATAGLKLTGARVGLTETCASADMTVFGMSSASDSPLSTDMACGGTGSSGTRQLHQRTCRTPCDSQSHSLWEGERNRRATGERRTECCEASSSEKLLILGALARPLFDGTSSEDEELSVGIGRCFARGTARTTSAGSVRGVLEEEEEAAGTARFLAGGRSSSDELLSIVMTRFVAEAVELDGAPRRSSRRAVEAGIDRDGAAAAVNVIECLPISFQKKTHA